VPGIITSVAALITAVGGLITALSAISAPSAETPTPTPVPPASPIPAICGTDVEAAFADAWDYGRLGCPVEPAERTSLAWQSYERGSSIRHVERGHVHVLYRDEWEQVADETQVGARIGKETREEQSYEGTLQVFQRGLIITGPDGTAYLLYDQDGTWEEA
jgi:hypothetical protein